MAPTTTGTPLSLLALAIARASSRVVASGFSTRTPFLPARQAASACSAFQDKEDLLAAVLEWWARETAALGIGERTGLRGFNDLRVLMTYHVEHRGLLELFIRLTGEASHEKHPARAFIQQRYGKIVDMLVGRLLSVAQAGEIPPITHGQAESEIRALCAAMDGLEIQWLLDPTVDLVGLFDQHLDHTLDRWGQGRYVPGTS
nr:hypothetical protein [Nonomuraea sp. NEAU-A123]